MIGDEHNQRQHQQVKQTIGGAAPFVDVSCQFYTDAVVERMQKNVDCYSPDHLTDSIRETMEGIKKAQLVRVLHQEGRVTRVFCHLLKGGVCTSPRNPGVPCFLAEAKP